MLRKREMRGSKTPACEKMQKHQKPARKASLGNKRGLFLCGEEKRSEELEKRPKQPQKAQIEERYGPKGQKGRKWGKTGREGPKDRKNGRNTAQSANKGISGENRPETGANTAKWGKMRPNARKEP